MRKKTCVLLLLPILLISCDRIHHGFDVGVGRVASMGDGEYSYGATIDGVMTSWSVPFSRVLTTPDWSPDSEPPLPLSQAVRLAQADVAKYTDTPAAFRLDKVEWMNVTNGSPSKKWIYLVSFERDWEFQGKRFEDRGTITIPVLLDGTVIQGSRAK